MSERRPGKLSTWKEIGEYLHVSVDTVQRWERRYGLPVSRIGVHVGADPAELDRWFAKYRDVAMDANREPHEPPPPHVHKILSQLKSLLPSHPWFVLVSSTTCAALFVVSLFLEIAYEFDRFYGSVALLAPCVFLGSFGLVLLTFQLIARFARRQGDYGLWVAIGVLVAGAVAIWAGSSPCLPDYPIVQSHPQMASGQVAHLRNIFYVLLILLFFALPQYQFVLTIDRVGKGERQSLRRLMSGKHSWSLPVYIQPSWMFAELILIFVLSFVSGYTLVSGLIPGRHFNLFLSLLASRVALQFALATACLFWYSRSLGTWESRAYTKVSTEPQQHTGLPGG